MSGSQQLLLGGKKAADAVYVEDVFSTYLYTGNGSTQTINNGIDLAGKGGMTLLQSRSNDVGTAWNVYDTVRGVRNYLRSNGTDVQSTAGAGAGLTAFNSNGFTLGTNWNTENFSPYTYASWTLREQPKFFDVVTWTGDGVDGRNIPHNLGSTPGCIIIKRLTGGGGSWAVWHRSLGDPTFGGASAAFGLLLNTNDASGLINIFKLSQFQTSTSFRITSDTICNASGSTYVAYVFAHNAGGFGLSGTDNVISCGSFTTNGSGVATVNLGYEPQWILSKASSGTNAAGDPWRVVDSMRGIAEVNAAYLYPSLTNAEQYLSNGIRVTPTGFTTANGVIAASTTYIYIAIRRPMKVPTTGTSVFAPVQSSTTAPWYKTSFPVDAGWGFSTAGSDMFFADRLRGQRGLFPYNTNAELAVSGFRFDYQNGWNTNSTGNANYYAWNFRRAPGFFDVVCYTGTSTNRTVTHNLAAVPELMIIKRRDFTRNWAVGSTYLSNTEYLKLNLTDAKSSDIDNWNNTTPTSSVFSLGQASGLVNDTGGSYVAYLFASCPGVSKVGSYTGNGSSQTINCGFTGGARFVMIKRTDSTGYWYVWDTARGIVAGNDPHLSLNTTAAEVTSNDTIDPDSTGFVVNQVAATNVNVSGGTYIYLAIA